jgi:hypothetical protein
MTDGEGTAGIRVAKPGRTRVDDDETKPMREV